MGKAMDKSRHLRASLATPTTQLALGGAAIGLLLFILLYGFTPLNMTNDSWLRGGYVEKDVIQHYAGWLFYRSSPLGFPLGVAGQMDYPTGGYIGFTDSIPLFALLFRPFASLLPASFQYFGLWGFLCSGLQGAAAALLLSLFSTSKKRILLLTTLFVLAPILLDRQLRHGALGAQWLILFSLYLYFKHRRTGRFFSPGFVALSALSITIHPYFIPMVFALLFALLVENAFLQRQWRQPLAMLALCLGACAGAGWLLGAFMKGSAAGSTPYGYFSMNLNALFNPEGRGYHWSLLLPPLNQRAGNYDGFNYLGLGLGLALACLTIDGLLHLRKWPVASMIKRHGGLLFVSAFLTLFAISNEVSAQGRLLFVLPLPTSLLRLATIFRSSGRMFYPVWYLLLLAACLYLLRRPALRWRTLAAGLLVAIQLIDLSPGLVAKAQSFRPYQPLVQSPLHSPFWQQTAGQYQHLASLDADGLQDSIFLALYAADNGMTTDDPFSARFDLNQREQQVAANIEALRTGTFREDTLYITSTPAVFLDLAEALDTKLFCARIDDHWFVFAPYNTGFKGYHGSDAVPVSAIPFTIADYSDALWDHGVLIESPNIVSFEDTAFARSRLEGKTALIADGVRYPILKIDYGDVGWLLVTLDTPSALPLQGVPLKSE